MRDTPWPHCSGDEKDMDRCRVCGTLLHCRSCGYGEPAPDGLCYQCRQGEERHRAFLAIHPPRRLSDAIEQSDRAAREQLTTDYVSNEEP